MQNTSAVKPSAVSGTDQARRKTTHATRNDPPPLLAAMRGKRQMLPVPTAMPRVATSSPQRLANTSLRLIARSPRGLTKAR